MKASGGLRHDTAVPWPDDTPAPARTAVATYLSAIERRLPGPTRARRATVVPDTAVARATFLLLISTIKIVPAAVHVTAIALLASTRLTTCDTAGRRRMLRLGRAVTAALLLSMFNMAGIVLVGSDVVRSGPLISLALSAAVGWALVGSLRANREVRHVEPAGPTGPAIGVGGAA